MAALSTANIDIDIDDNNDNDMSYQMGWRACLAADWRLQKDTESN